MAKHARLNIEFTEDEKYHNLTTWLIYINSIVTTHTILKDGQSD